MGDLENCEVCDRPVLELEGQLEILQPYYAESEDPDFAAAPSTRANHAPPTVRVLVSARPAREVRVIATDRLTCLVPTGDVGTVDVVVQNLDGASRCVYSMTRRGRRSRGVSSPG